MKPVFVYGWFVAESNKAGVRIKDVVLPWDEVRGLSLALGQAWIENERAEGRLPRVVEGDAA